MTGIIEIQKGSNYKYEIDKQTGQLVLDRVLKMHYPQNYGYIPNTLSEDGDPIDIFVYSESPINPLVKVHLDILGVVVMTDNSIKDEKLICRIKNTTDIVDLTFSQILYFLKNYKDGVIINLVEGKEKALQILEESKIRYEKKNNTQV